MPDADVDRDQVISFYNVPEEKIHVIPFGTNFDMPTKGEVDKCISERPTNVCNLTFIGKDWTRKGLPLAYYLLRYLNDAGVNATLNVVGGEVELPRIDKRIAYKIRYGPYSTINYLKLITIKRGT